MATVRLRNGFEEAQVAVQEVMFKLQELAESNDFIDRLTLWDLGKMVEDPHYRPIGPQLRKLQALSLTDSNGKMHDSVKNIVESAVVIELAGAYLQSPITPPNP